jgi:hypothetical protein
MVASMTMDERNKRASAEGGDVLGPIDYIVVGFKGNSFDGSIMRELEKAVKDNVIRVLDLLFIMKDANGNVVDGEYIDQSDAMREMFGDIAPADDTPLLSDSDITKISDDMDNETAAGVLVVEQLWAKGIKKALMDAGGFLIADGRIHPEAVEAAVKELQTA